MSVQIILEPRGRCRRTFSSVSYTSVRHSFVVGLLVIAGCGGGGGTADSGTPGSAGSSGVAGAGGNTGDAGTSGGAGSSGSAGNAGTSGSGGGTAGGSAGVSGTAGGPAGAGGRGGAAGASAGAGGRGGAAAGAGGGAAGAAGATGVAGMGGRGGGAAGTGGRGGAAGGTTTAVTWMTRVLSTQHFAEGADVGDINGDGSIDLVAGPNWYAGPAFSATVSGTVIANPPTFNMNSYSTFFLTFVDDVNGDSRPDVIAIGDAGGGNGTGNPNNFWYQNPGPANLGQAWTRTALYNGLVGNESPAYVNLVGDARRELVFMVTQQLGYASRPATATAAWAFTSVTGNSFSPPYVHGLGAGDVDGDGLVDLLERTGWWRQVSGATWERHAFEFWTGSTSGRSSNWGGSQMHVFDVDGDGDNDVVTVLAAHQYGLAWFEHQGTGTATTFVAHPILPTTAGSGNISQLHSLQIADVNGDGLTDLVAGKRYYAHPANNADPGTTDPAVLSWFELQRGAGGATFVQRVIHMDSGAGCNFVARDLTGDGKVDIFTANKRGIFLHVQQ
jgi:hypothetical protein